MYYHDLNVEEIKLGVHLQVSNWRIEVLKTCSLLVYPSQQIHTVVLESMTHFLL